MSYENVTMVVEAVPSTVRGGAILGPDDARHLESGVRFGTVSLQPVNPGPDIAESLVPVFAGRPQFVRRPAA